MSRLRARFFDPDGLKHGGIATYPWQQAPDGLATRRQLTAAGLRPNGQEPAAQIRWMGRSGERFADLYHVAKAAPKRTATPAQRAAIAKACAARRVCPTCDTDVGYTIPTSLGECVDCHDTRETQMASWGLRPAIPTNSIDAGPAEPTAVAESSESDRPERTTTMCPLSYLSGRHRTANHTPRPEAAREPSPTDTAEIVDQAEHELADPATDSDLVVIDTADLDELRAAHPWLFTRTDRTEERLAEAEQALDRDDTATAEDNAGERSSRWAADDSAAAGRDESAEVSR